MPGFEWAYDDPNVTEKALHIEGSETGNNGVTGLPYTRFSMRPCGGISRTDWEVRWALAFPKKERA